MNRAKRPGGWHFLAAVRHPARRDGVIALVLFLLPWVALALVHGHRLDSGTTVAVIASLAATSIGLSTLWLTWAALQEAKRSGSAASGLNLGQVADRLAVAVGTQWKAEAAIRRLNDPYPLSVSWAAADKSLTDTWDSLVTLATSGAGWPSQPRSGTWARGPDGLAGEGGALVDVLIRVPTGRLVVLGEPGAGKTMLMVRLVLDLLAVRADGSPVPILVSAAAWDPANQDLRGWLAAQLLIDHPSLAAAPPAGLEEPNQAAALIASGLILPVLDGLDEIPRRVRGSAISRINEALQTGEQLVVTCRSQEYRDAVRPKGGVEVTLRAAAAVQLRQLDTDAVRRYLCDDAGGPVAKARWDPVLAVLGTEAPAGQALTTPLMVGLARAIYNPLPGELAGGLRKPKELCEPGLASRAAVESLLFDAFIPAAYRNDTAGRWTARQAEAWLVFLARHLERGYSRPNLGWWEVGSAVSLTAPSLVAGLGVSLAAALGFGFGFGLHAGLVAGLVAGVVAGLVFGLVFGLAVKFRTGLDFAIGSGVLGLGIPLGVVIGGVAGEVAADVIAGAIATASSSLMLFQWQRPDLPETVNPRTVLKFERHRTLFPALVFGLVAGPEVGLAFGLVFGPVAGLGAGFGAGLGAGFAVGLTGRHGQSLWASYVLAKGWLAMHHRLPWSLMDFLADAHKRGVLRQTGAVYQFRHIRLQQRLASRRCRQPGA